MGDLGDSVAIFLPRHLFTSPDPTRVAAARKDDVVCFRSARRRLARNRRGSVSYSLIFLHSPLLGPRRESQKNPEQKLRKQRVFSVTFMAFFSWFHSLHQSPWPPHVTCRAR